MNVSTAMIKIQLSTLLSNVCLPNCLPKMFWTGLTKLMGAKISPTTEETLFGITASTPGTTTIWKFNYTALFMCYYIYSSKFHCK